jgi:hypothetical protein
LSLLISMFVKITAIQLDLSNINVF